MPIGTAVAAIQALVAAGYIESAGDEPRADMGGTPKRLYRITDAGRVEANRQRAVALAVFGVNGPARDTPVAPGASARVAAPPPEDDEPAVERFVVLDEG